LGSEHPHTLGSMETLGLVLQFQGKYEEAEALFRDVFDVKRKKLGAEHPDTVATLKRLDKVLQDQGKGNPGGTTL